MSEHGDVRDTAPGRHRAIEVTLVTSEGCHYCSHALELLERLREDHPIRVRTVSLADDEGAAIARRFRVPYPPVLLFDGAYFGHGRISRRKLAKHLAEMAAGGPSP